MWAVGVEAYIGDDGVEISSFLYMYKKRMVRLGVDYAYCAEWLNLEYKARRTSCYMLLVIASLVVYNFGV